MTEPREPSRGLPLTEPEYCALVALALEGELHGYGLIQAVERLTGGSVRLRTGTLYVVLRRLAERGLIAESDRERPPGDDSRRRYYEITAEGVRLARAEADRLASLARLAESSGLLPEGG